MFPKPTALPADASTTPNLLPKLPRLSICCADEVKFYCAANTFCSHELQIYKEIPYLCINIHIKQLRMLTHYIKTYPLGLLVTLAILVLSLAPIPEVPAVEDVPLADKWTHMVMYATLTLTIWWQYLRSHKCICWQRLIVFGVLAPAAWGGLMELAQAYLTTYRSGDWWDFVANSIGVLIAVVIGLAVHRRFLKK